jgi:hypothetical protein
MLGHLYSVEIQASQGREIHLQVVWSGGSRRRERLCSNGVVPNRVADHHTICAIQGEYNSQVGHLGTGIVDVFGSRFRYADLNDFDCSMTMFYNGQVFIQIFNSFSTCAPMVFDFEDSI